MAEYDRRGETIREYAVSYLYTVGTVTGVTRSDLVSDEVWSPLPGPTSGS